MLTEDDKKVIGEIVADTIKDMLFPTLENMHDSSEKLRTDMNQRFDEVDATLNRLEGKTDRLSDDQRKLKDEVEEIKAIPVIAHELRSKKQ